MKENEPSKSSIVAVFIIALLFLIFGGSKITGNIIFDWFFAEPVDEEPLLSEEFGNFEGPVDVVIQEDNNGQIEKSSTPSTKKARGINSPIVLASVQNPSPKNPFTTVSPMAYCTSSQVVDIGAEHDISGRNIIYTSAGASLNNELKVHDLIQKKSILLYTTADNEYISNPLIEGRYIVYEKWVLGNAKTDIMAYNLVDGIAKNGDDVGPYRIAQLTSGASTNPTKSGLRNKVYYYQDSLGSPSVNWCSFDIASGPGSCVEGSFNTFAPQNRNNAQNFKSWGGNSKDPSFIWETFIGGSQNIDLFSVWRDNDRKTVEAKILNLPNSGGFSEIVGLGPMFIFSESSLENPQQASLKEGITVLPNYKRSLVPSGDYSDIEIDVANLQNSKGSVYFAWERIHNLNNNWEILIAEHPWRGEIVATIKDMRRPKVDGNTITFTTFGGSEYYKPIYKLECY